MVSDIKASCGLRETPVTSPTSLTYFSSHCRASECLTQPGGKSCWAGYSYQDRLRCVTVLLKSTGCSPKTSLSPGLWVSLSPSPTLSVCLSPFPSLACRIDPLNAFRISHLTSCTCCFSSSVSPLGVQRENLADRFSFFLFSFHGKSIFFIFSVCRVRRTILHQCKVYEKSKSCYLYAEGLCWAWTSVNISGQMSMRKNKISNCWNTAYFNYISLSYTETKNNFWATVVRTLYRTINAHWQ